MGYYIAALEYLSNKYPKHKWEKSDVHKTEQGSPMYICLDCGSVVDAVGWFEIKAEQGC